MLAVGPQPSGTINVPYAVTLQFDGTADGTVDAFDRNTVWRVQNGASGYLSGDFNLDGKADALDVNNIWLLNNGSATQVP